MNLKWLVTALLPVFLFVSTAYAQPAPPAPGRSGTGRESKVDASEEDDFKQTPYTRFGDFQSDEEEADDARFLQFGRFFGLGIGAGFEGATGNRGILYQGGFPAVEVKVVYWFDFTTSLVLSIYNAKHHFSGTLDGETAPAQYDVNIMRIGADFRYYFDTKDLSAPITFSNPYITAGLGSYRKTQSSLGSSDVGPTTDNSFGFALGGGFEFVVAPKKTYFNLEAKVHSVNFNDTGTKVILSKQTIPNTQGLFFSLMGSLLFTW